MVDSLRREVLTEVRATIDPSQEDALVTRFEQLVEGPRPDGLLRTELLRVDREWRIQTLWRDREALTAMRASTEEPAAPALFRSVGGQPTLTSLDVFAATGR